MLRNISRINLLALLLAGLSFTSLRLSHALPDPIILKHQEQWYTLSQTYAYGVATGDLDNDGMPEIVAAGRYHTGSTSYAGEQERYGQIKIWSWNGTGYALRHVLNWTLAGDGNPWWRGINSITIDDVDSDGTKELITAGYVWEHIPVASWMGTYECEVGIWNWNGTLFVGELNQTWQNPTGRVEPNSVFSKDVDNDGQVELLTGGLKRDGSVYMSQLRIWNWNGTAMSLEHNEEWATNCTRGVITVFADNVDQEGLPDILTGSYGNSTSFDVTKVWNWNGTDLRLMHNEEDPFSQGEYVYAFAHADADMDGKPELVSFGHAYNGSTWLASLRMLEWTGMGMALDHHVTWGNNTRGLDVCIADVNDDYDNEILTAAWEYDGLRWNSQLSIYYYEDSNPPSIGIPVQEPAINITTEQEVKVSAEITDNETGIKNATLYYTIDNGTTWTPVAMIYNDTSGLYEAAIPPQALGTYVQYMITAYDNAENQATEDNAGEYYVYGVIPEYPILMLLIFTAITATTAILVKTRRKP